MEQTPVPTVMRFGPYRFFFYSNEGEEPRHVHVRAGDREAKFWLVPLELAWNYGLNDRELRQLERHIRDNVGYRVESWDQFFGV